MRIGERDGLGNRLVLARWRGRFRISLGALTRATEECVGIGALDEIPRSPPRDCSDLLCSLKLIDER
jgi:hypothetical protein